MAPAKHTEPVVDLAKPVAHAATAPCDDTTVLPQSGYLTADWVKRRYSISNSTLYKWVATKDRFPAPVKIGPRAVRWSAESLRAFEAALGTGE